MKQLMKRLFSGRSLSAALLVAMIVSTVLVAGAGTASAGVKPSVRRNRKANPSKPSNPSSDQKRAIEQLQKQQQQILRQQTRISKISPDTKISQKGRR